MQNAKISSRRRVTWHPFGPAGEMLVRDMQANRPSFSSGRQYTAVSLDWNDSERSMRRLGGFTEDRNSFSSPWEGCLLCETSSRSLLHVACVNPSNKFLIYMLRVRFKLRRGSSGLSHNIGLSGKKTCKLLRDSWHPMLSLWFFFVSFGNASPEMPVKQIFLKGPSAILTFFLPKPFCPKNVPIFFGRSHFENRPFS